MNKINKAISDKQKEWDENKKLDDRLFQLKENLQKGEIKLDALKLRLSELSNEISELEELSVLKKFVHFFKRPPKNLESLRSQYLADFKIVESLSEEVRLLSYEQKVIMGKYRVQTDIEREFKELIAKKYFQLKSSDTKFSKELFSKDSEIGRYKLQIQKTNTALKRGEIVTKLLDILEHELVSVKGKMLGVGSFTESERRRYLNLSKAKLKTAESRLNEFFLSLKSIDSSISLDQKLDSFDFFLMSLKSTFLDKKILEKESEDSLSDMRRIKERIAQIKVLLTNKKEVWVKQHSALEISKEAYIKNY